MRKILFTLVSAIVVPLSLVAVPTAAHAASVPFDPISSSSPIDGYAYNAQVTSGYATDVCYGRLRDGAQAAYNYMDSVFGWPTPGTMYACREMDHCGDTTVDPNTNPYFHSTCWSNHAQRRAIDLMVGGNAPDPLPLGRGNDLVNWLFQADAGGNPHARARRLGVQQIIWNNRCWSSSSSADRAVTTASAMRVCGEGITTTSISISTSPVRTDRRLPTPGRPATWETSRSQATETATASTPSAYTAPAPTPSTSTTATPPAPPNTPSPTATPR